MFKLLLYLYLTKDNFFPKQTQYFIQMKILFHKIHIVIPCSQVIWGRSQSYVPHTLWGRNLFKTYKLWQNCLHFSPHPQVSEDLQSWFHWQKRDEGHPYYTNDSNHLWSPATVTSIGSQCHGCLYLQPFTYRSQI